MLWADKFVLHGNMQVKHSVCISCLGKHYSLNHIIGIDNELNGPAVCFFCSFLNLPPGCFFCKYSDIWVLKTITEKKAKTQLNQINFLIKTSWAQSMICSQKLLCSFVIFTHSYLWETRIYQEISPVLKRF